MATADAPATAHDATAQAGEDYILAAENLRVRFHTVLGVTQALDGVTLQVPRGKVLGVVGESGCGKSMTGLSILQIIPHPGQIESGRILFKETAGAPPVDLLTYDRYGPAMRAVRGNRISMIFQEPMTSLNPCYTIGDQIVEAVWLHHRKQGEVKARALDMLHKVELPNPERMMTTYPHELSGGMRQRAMIAMALSCRPALLIADEPTTALDVTTEAQILDLMRMLQAEIGMSILFITHNMGVVAQMCDEVAVMYLGQVVEQAPVQELFDNPQHPYTISLLRSIPRLGSGRRVRLEAISGAVPDPYSRVPGCPFHPRCPVAAEGICDTVVPAVTRPTSNAAHFVRCHLYG